MAEWGIGCGSVSHFLGKMIAAGLIEVVNDEPEPGEAKTHRWTGPEIDATEGMLYHKA